MWRKATRQPNPKKPVYLITDTSVVMLFRSLITNACTLGFLGAATTYSLGLLLFSPLLSPHFSLLHFVGCITSVTQSLFRLSLLARLCFFYFSCTLTFSLLLRTRLAVVFTTKYVFECWFLNERVVISTFSWSFQQNLTQARPICSIFNLPKGYWSDLSCFPKMLARLSMLFLSISKAVIVNL